MKIGFVIFLLLVLTSLVFGCTKIETSRKFLTWAIFEGPNHSFTNEKKPALTDYSDLNYWAAHPLKKNSSDFVASNSSYELNISEVNVFFIHHTSFYGSKSWLYNINFRGPTFQNTQWVLRNQASVFNKCCNIYAPFYSQVSMFTYIKNYFQPKKAEEILDYAYKDIERAFSYFVKYFNNGKPFVLASHSQGSHHAYRLIKEVIDNQKDLSQLMVVAYSLGSVHLREWSDQYFSSLSNIDKCDSPLQTSCVVHWDTIKEGSRGFKRLEGSLCVNPLSWRVDGGKISSKKHIGALSPVGDYFFPNETDPKFTKIRKVNRKPKFEVKEKLLSAECREDSLYVTALPDSFFYATPEIQRVETLGDYHLLDYSLFYFDIQRNVHDRIKAFNS